MANDSGVKMRFRPAGSRRKRSGTAVYGPLDTGCPAVEQAVSALYRAQNEESFWTLMNALNYALELDTRVLIPLQASPDPQAKPVPWAGSSMRSPCWAGWSRLPPACWPSSP